MNTQELQDIFEAYSLETPDGNDFDILRKYMEKYPGYKRDLAEFAKERALLKFDLQTEISSDEKNRLAKISRSKFEEFWANRDQEITRIESLTKLAKTFGMKKIEFARKIGLNGTQLFNLEVRRFVFTTIPQSLISTIAETLQTTKDAVAQFLDQSPGVAANYKSETRPDEIEQISFSQAVQEDETLSAEEKERLLNLK